MAKAKNKHGGSGETARGEWCTPKNWADAVGPFDVDVFSNRRSHIQAPRHCMLERGDNALVPDKLEGTYFIAGLGEFHAGKRTRVWVQPPYELVTEALDYYGHTRFCFLLRFDPRTKWFHRLYRMAALICVPRKIEFEPPPGISASANIFPHALYYANSDDVTPEVLRKSAAAWRVK